MYVITAGYAMAACSEALHLSTHPTACVIICLHFFVSCVAERLLCHVLHEMPHASQFAFSMRRALLGLGDAWHFFNTSDLEAHAQDASATMVRRQDMTIGIEVISAFEAQRCFELSS